jgi:hypothetical protein
MTAATETARSLTARELFEAFGDLGPLRVISVNGPSVFEAILELGAFGVADDWLNAMTPDYHWHVDLSRVRHLTTRDTIHERSGRRVLFFELREAAEAEPFLRVYLHRGKGEDFAVGREEGFAALQERFAEGAALTGVGGGAA